MLIVLSMIEDLAKFLFGESPIKVDWDSLVNFLLHKEDCVLIEDYEGAGIARDGNKIVIYTPINIVEGGIEENDDLSWLKDWAEFRPIETFEEEWKLMPPKRHVKPLKRYAGKVIVN